MSKRKKSTIEVGPGEICRKCGKQMKRFSHGQNWKPKQRQPYFFRYWDKCKCGMLQHYEAAKVSLVEDVSAEPSDELTAAYRATIG